MEHQTRREPCARRIIPRTIARPSPGDGSDPASIAPEHDRAEREDHGPVPRDYEPEKRCSVGLAKEGAEGHRSMEEVLR